MLKREETAILEAYEEERETQAKDEMSHPEEFICSLCGSKQNIIDWETLIACVKAKYLQANQVKTIFDRTQDIESCNINLAIIEERDQDFEQEKWLYQERLNSYEEIPGEKILVSPQYLFFHNNKELKHQLILGRAGIGKSTMSQYLAYQWAKKGWWKDESFKLLIWIPLRQLMNECIYPSRAPISLGKIFYNQYSEQLKAQFIDEKEWIEALDDLINEHSAEIVYILDGFDEVAHVWQLGRRVLPQTKILRSLLSQERVVITSRPYYIEDYLASQGIKVDRRLENMGLVRENIYDYIQSYPWKTPAQPKALQSYLDSSSLMRGIAHIPINLALLCHHWCTHQQIEISHFSMSSLYEGLVGDFLGEYSEKPSGKGDGNNKDEILENETAQLILLFLEKLAFLQMQENMLLISSARVAELLKELGIERERQEAKKILKTGLLVSVNGNEQPFEEERAYTFIHLTFQEFLAARYIARIFKQNEELSREVILLKSEKITSQPLKLFMQNYKYDLRYEIVWWFVAGLLKEHSSLEIFFNYLLSAPRDLSGSYDILLWIKCLEKSELSNNLNEAIKNALIGKIKKRAHALLEPHLYLSKKQCSKTFFEYLYSSPMVYEKIGILQTEKSIREALKILQWHSNLPSHVLNILINLLSDEEEEVKELVLTTFKNQINFPSDALNSLVDLLIIRSGDWYICARVFTILKRQINLPADVLSKLVNLLRDGDYVVKRAIRYQKNSPSEVLHAMTSLLTEKEKNIASWAQSVLSCPNHLLLDVLIILVTLLSNRNEGIRLAAQSALASQKNLPPSVLVIIVGLLNNVEPAIRGSALRILGGQTNLSSDVLNKIVHSLKEPWPVDYAAASALKRQVNLSPDLLPTVISLMPCKKGEIRSAMSKILTNHLNLSLAAVYYLMQIAKNKKMNTSNRLEYVFSHQTNLPLDILHVLVDWLSEGDEETSVALELLLRQMHLPTDILHRLLNLLSSKDEWEIGQPLTVLTGQMNLPSNILSSLLNLLGNKDKEISDQARFTLSYQVSLPPDILSALADLLSNKEVSVKNLALKVLGRQSNLPFNILSKAVTSIVNKNQINETNNEEVDFIYQQLVLILDNPVLQSQLSSNIILLSDVVLKQTFSEKSIVYFENNQSLVIRLRQQLRQIAIKNKSNFIQTFIERRKIWLNNQDADYLLIQIIEPLSALSLKK